MSSGSLPPALTTTPTTPERDYRWGALHGVLIAVLATVMAEHTERGDDMLSLMAIRHAKHAIDLNVLDLVRRSQV